jgi:Cell cycle protein
VVVGFVPTKGLPLPFISLGGSSLVMTLTSVGILLGISARIPPLRGSRTAFDPQQPETVKQTADEQT